jgi:crossover junction endodeoxyribonuclease RuvC
MRFIVVNTRAGRLRKLSESRKRSRTNASENRAQRHFFTLLNNMLTKSPTILAIDPGAKELGFAILADNHLNYYGVKTFKRRQPAHGFLSDVTRFVNALIAEHEPSALAIERTYLTQKTSALLNVAAAEIKFTARQKGLVVYEYAPPKVRNAICQTEKATKHDTTRVIATRFPALTRFLEPQSKWERLVLTKFTNRSKQSGANY